jgi:hypothetical protein
MALQLIQFLAIILTALALVPSGAHLAALPNKIAMAQAAYFVSQQIYAGWALFDIVLFGALVANLAHVIVLRKLGRSSGYALAEELIPRGTKSSNPAPSSRQSRLSPDFASVSGKARGFGQFGDHAAQQCRQRRAQPRNIVRRSGSVSVGLYSSTAGLPDADRDIAALAASEVGCRSRRV